MTFSLTQKLLAALMVLAVASTSHADILLNAGFENGTGGDADDWGEFAGPNGTTTRSAADPFSGGFSAYMEFDNSVTGTPAAYFIEQNLGANTIDPLENLDLSFWAKVDSTNFVGHDIFFEIQFLDQDGSNGGGFKGGLLQSLIVAGINTTYQQFSFTDIDVPDDADSFLLRFQASAGAVQDAGNVNGLYVDDAVLSVTQAIPEPTSAGFLALVSLGLIGFRRRR